MSTTITLEYPITINGVEVKELTMRRPRVKDSLIHEKQFTNRQGTLEADIAMFARLCNVAPKDLDALDMADVVQLQKVFGSFFSSTDSLSGEPV